MKLVAVMSLDAEREALHRVYREHDIRVFSEIDIQGYHHEQAPSAAQIGWFGHSVQPAYSTLTWAFLADEKADALMDAIRTFNTTHAPNHPVRAFLMPVEDMV